MNALADPEQPVFVAAGNVQQPQFRGRLRMVLDEVGGGLVFGAEEKPPTQAKVSRLFSPKLSACPPPMDRPARARDSRSAFTE